MKIQRMHHVAYRCRDARETVEWYGKHLNMDFVLAIAEDHVPSTHEPDPYMHLFLDAGGGNILAFFELHFLDDAQPTRQLRVAVFGQELHDGFRSSVGIPSSSMTCASRAISARLACASSSFSTCSAKPACTST